MKTLFHISLLLFFCYYFPAISQDGQLNIGRVELMPNEPAPFNVRDWADVARKFDAFVFDTAKTGQYLPLVFLVESGVSYPENPTFGLHTYVGTNNTMSGEAINVLPALVGASLVGLDKSDHLGYNWILMSQDYFNKNNNERIYLNNRGGSSGNDWWYDMMPNIYFYQLFDLYGPVGDAENQFHSVADQMLEAVRHMGGSDTPWQRASMNYRAWNFSTMEPNEDGVPEPEAAGAYAWLLYHAYGQTGNHEYLKGAEWSIEYLNSLGSNPSYELQLPYGAYIAARMNAELNTSYAIDKMLFWVFNRGPLRGWGTIVGEWNGFDVSGLVGEANDGGNDYAFQMNGVQQAAAIVPLVRYDKRYARAIGKWFLNLTNATRLMFPGFLPSELQDASNWSQQYDPDAVIGYEAMREVWEGKSPFATGDAVRGGWAATNLALYGTSSIGYLGALFEKTNDPKILLIDLLKTDFFGEAAYPSYLIYNPYSITKNVEINVGPDPVDIYDVLTETFLHQNVNDNVIISLPADQAASIVLAPAGGTIEYNKNKMRIDGVIVDYAQTQQQYNADPRIQALAVIDTTVERGDTIDVFGAAVDLETKDPVFEWSASGGEIIGSGETIQWVAPDTVKTYTITLVAHDEDDQSDTATINLHVVDEVNLAPVIESLLVARPYVDPSGSIPLSCQATDGNGDPLTYNWMASGGQITGTGPVVEWTPGGEEGIFTIQVQVRDDEDASDVAQVRLLSYLFTDNGAQVVAHYPIEGNAQDISGNNLHGDVQGAKLTFDRFGIESSAYFFDGINDHITVTNDDILNFSEGITLSCWVRPLGLNDRESFILSHGSWQNRWKISVIPDHKIRWTLRTSTGQVRDIDSQTVLEEDKWYHVAATYDGSIFLVYINGCLETFTTLTGAISNTALDLEFGQMLPDDQSYNFRGDIDDVRIYNHALGPDSIAVLGEKQSTSVNHPKRTNSFEIYPNPAKDQVWIKSNNAEASDEQIEIIVYNSSGNVVGGFPGTPAFSGGPLNTTHMPSGLYFIKITSDNSVDVLPLIITR